MKYEKQMEINILPFFKLNTTIAIFLKLNRFYQIIGKILVKSCNDFTEAFRFHTGARFQKFRTFKKLSDLFWKIKISAIHEKKSLIMSDFL